MSSFRERLDGMAAALDDFRRAGRSVVYVNDANGNWDGNAPAHVEAAIHGNGADVVKHFAPREDNLFLFKPRYSGFDQTPLALVRAGLSVDRVWIAGPATEGVRRLVGANGSRTSSTRARPRSGCASGTERCSAERRFVERGLQLVERFVHIDRAELPQLVF